MTFLEKIKTLPDKKLDKVIARRIRYLEDKKKKNDPDENIIGYHVDYNPTYYGSEDGEKLEINLRCVYNDFVTKDSKLVYGMYFDDEGFASNRGMYYYLDDQSYLFDFCKYIRDVEDLNDYYFFGYIRDFICEYCGVLRGLVAREQMHAMLADSTGRLLPASRKHSISDFKGRGNAYCTEYAVMAHNILQLFGYDSSIIIGNAVFDEVGEGHAYNVVSFIDDESGEEVEAVIDFMNPIDIYDFNYEKIGEEPFIGFIDDLSDEDIDEFLNGERHFVFDEYYYMFMHESLMRIDTEGKREYYISNDLCEDMDVNYSKKYES